MSARPAIAFALGLAAAPAFAESGQEWLTRMGAALNNASYVGEFVSESAERTERLAITHRVRDGVVSERLVSLSGHGRELVRENDEVVVYLPDQKLAIIERRSGRSDLMGALPQFEGRMASWYKVDWVGRETLDDFGPTAVVAVRPLDGYRFGYRLWIDVDSHMLRKAVERHFDIEMVEVITAEDIEIHKEGSEFTMRAAYDDTVPLAGNVSFLVEFDKSVTVSAR